jgi:mannose-6-phosphate isomerase-like protein (cupin superfamily)
MKNGKTMMLKDGDCVYMDGTVHHPMSKMKSKKKMH